MRSTLATLKSMHSRGEKIVMLTCYDASFAAMLDVAGVDVLLVGDSLGMVVQGQESTLPVSLSDMIYHTVCVARGATQAFIICDMPFGTSQVSPEKTFEHAAKLMAAGAQMVKIEGGAAMIETVRFLTTRGIPVCAHLGLTPQSVHQLGGYRVQAREKAAAMQLIEDAVALEAAGAGMVVLEVVPALLAEEVTAQLNIPTIGIGAGAACAGQVLVLYDLLNIYPGKKARFVKNFMQGAASIDEAVRQYVSEVKDGRFPLPEHEF